VQSNFLSDVDVTKELGEVIGRILGTALAGKESDVLREVDEIEVVHDHGLLVHNKSDSVINTLEELKDSGLENLSSYCKRSVVKVLSNGFLIVAGSEKFNLVFRSLLEDVVVELIGQNHQVGNVVVDLEEKRGVSFVGVKRHHQESVFRGSISCGDFHGSGS